MLCLLESIKVFDKYGDYVLHSVRDPLIINLYTLRPLQIAKKRYYYFVKMYVYN